MPSAVKASSWTTADETNKVFGLGIDVDAATTARAVAGRIVTVSVPEAAGALHGEGIFVEDLAVGDTLISALRITVFGDTVTVDNLSADATITDQTITFAGEDFGAGDTLVLTYINAA